MFVPLYYAFLGIPPENQMGPKLKGRTEAERLTEAFRLKYQSRKAQMITAYGEEEGTQLFEEVTLNPDHFLHDSRPLVKDLATNAGIYISKGQNKGASNVIKSCFIYLYDTLGGPNWHKQKGWVYEERYEPPSVWFGITMANGALTSIKLPHNHVAGPVNEALKKLGSLQEVGGGVCRLRELNLSANYLTGVLDPAAISQLKSLVILCLNFNQIEGSIPTTFNALQELAVLTLQGNQFIGSIPRELGGCQNLKILHLYQNKLTGPLPAELGNLRLLEELRVWDNQLTGPIPAELGNLENLKVLHLAENKFSGTVPSEVGNMEKLQYLYLNDNKFTGKVPVGALVSLKQIRAIYLSNNEFEDIEQTDAALRHALEDVEINTLGGGVLYLGNEYPEVDRGALGHGGSSMSLPPSATAEPVVSGKSSPANPSTSTAPQQELKSAEEEGEDGKEETTAASEEAEEAPPATTAEETSPAAAEEE